MKDYYDDQDILPFPNNPELPIELLQDAQAQWYREYGHLEHQPPAAEQDLGLPKPKTKI